MGTKLFFRPKTIFANNVLLHFFNYFGISELEVPGTWKLGTWSSRNMGTSVLGNLFKGIPKKTFQPNQCILPKLVDNEVLAYISIQFMLKAKK